MGTHLSSMLKCLVLLILLTVEAKSRTKNKYFDNNRSLPSEVNHLFHVIPKDLLLPGAILDEPTLVCWYSKITTITNEKSKILKWRRSFKVIFQNDLIKGNRKIDNSKRKRIRHNMYRQIKIYKICKLLSELDVDHSEENYETDVSPDYNDNSDEASSQMKDDTQSLVETSTPKHIQKKIYDILQVKPGNSNDQGDLNFIIDMVSNITKPKITTQSPVKTSMPEDMKEKRKLHDIIEIKHGNNTDTDDLNFLINIVNKITKPKTTTESHAEISTPEEIIEKPKLHDNIEIKPGNYNDKDDLNFLIDIVSNITKPKTTTQNPVETSTPDDMKGNSKLHTIKIKPGNDNDKDDLNFLIDIVSNITKPKPQSLVETSTPEDIKEKAKLHNIIKTKPGNDNDEDDLNFLIDNASNITKPKPQSLVETSMPEDIKEKAKLHNIIKTKPGSDNDEDDLNFLIDIINNKTKSTQESPIETSIPKDMIEKLKLHDIIKIKPGKNNDLDILNILIDIIRNRKKPKTITQSPAESSMPEYMIEKPKLHDIIKIKPGKNKDLDILNILIDIIRNRIKPKTITEGPVETSIPRNMTEKPKLHIIKIKPGKNNDLDILNILIDIIRNRRKPKTINQNPVETSIPANMTEKPKIHDIIKIKPGKNNDLDILNILIDIIRNRRKPKTINQNPIESSKPENMVEKQKLYDIIGIKPGKNNDLDILNILIDIIRNRRKSKTTQSSIETTTLEDLNSVNKKDEDNISSEIETLINNVLQQTTTQSPIKTTTSEYFQNDSLETVTIKPAIISNQDDSISDIEALQKNKLQHTTTTKNSIETTTLETATTIIPQTTEIESENSNSQDDINSEMTSTNIPQTTPEITTTVNSNKIIETEPEKNNNYDDINSQIDALVNNIINNTTTSTNIPETTPETTTTENIYKSIKIKPEKNNISADIDSKIDALINNILNNKTSTNIPQTIPETTTTENIYKIIETEPEKNKSYDDINSQIDALVYNIINNTTTSTNIPETTPETTTTEDIYKIIKIKPEKNNISDDINSKIDALINNILNNKTSTNIPQTIPETTTTENIHKIIEIEPEKNNSYDGINSQIDALINNILKNTTSTNIPQTTPETTTTENILKIIETEPEKNNSYDDINSQIDALINNLLKNTTSTNIPQTTPETTTTENILKIIETEPEKNKSYDDINSQIDALINNLLKNTTSTNIPQTTPETTTTENIHKIIEIEPEKNNSYDDIKSQIDALINNILKNTTSTNIPQTTPETTTRENIHKIIETEPEKNNSYDDINSQIDALINNIFKNTTSTNIPQTTPETTTTENIHKIIEIEPEKNNSYDDIKSQIDALINNILKNTTSTNIPQTTPETTTTENIHKIIETEPEKNNSSQIDELVNNKINNTTTSTNIPETTPESITAENIHKVIEIDPEKDDSQDDSELLDDLMKNIRMPKNKSQTQPDNTKIENIPKTEEIQLIKNSSQDDIDPEIAKTPKKVPQTLLDTTKKNNISQTVEMEPVDNSSQNNIHPEIDALIDNNINNTKMPKNVSQQSLPDTSKKDNIPKIVEIEPVNNNSQNNINPEIDGLIDNNINNTKMPKNVSQTSLPDTSKKHNIPKIVEIEPVNNNSQNNINPDIDGLIDNKTNNTKMPKNVSQTSLPDTSKKDNIPKIVEIEPVNNSSQNNINPDIDGLIDNKTNNTKMPKNVSQTSLPDTSKKDNIPKIVEIEPVNNSSQNNINPEIDALIDNKINNTKMPKNLPQTLPETTTTDNIKHKIIIIKPANSDQDSSEVFNEFEGMMKNIRATTTPRSIKTTTPVNIPNNFHKIIKIKPKNNSDLDDMSSEIDAIINNTSQLTTKPSSIKFEFPKNTTVNIPKITEVEPENNTENSTPINEATVGEEIFTTTTSEFAENTDSSAPSNSQRQIMDSEKRNVDENTTTQGSEENTESSTFSVAQRMMLDDENLSENTDSDFDKPETQFPIRVIHVFQSGSIHVECKNVSGTIEKISTPVEPFGSYFNESKLPNEIHIVEVPEITIDTDYLLVESKSSTYVLKIIKHVQCPEEDVPTVIKIHKKGDKNNFKVEHNNKPTIFSDNNYEGVVVTEIDDNKITRKCSIIYNDLTIKPIKCPETKLHLPILQQPELIQMMCPSKVLNQMKFLNLKYFLEKTGIVIYKYKWITKIVPVSHEHESNELEDSHF